MIYKNHEISKITIYSVWDKTGSECIFDGDDLKECKQFIDKQNQ